MGLLPLWTECENMLMGRSLSLIKPWISCLKKKIRKEQSYFQICPFTSQAVMIFLFVCFVLWKNAMGDLGSLSSSWKSLCSPVLLEPDTVTVKAVVSVPAPPRRWHQWKGDPGCCEGSAASLDILTRGQRGEEIQGCWESQLMSGPCLGTF